MIGKKKNQQNNKLYIEKKIQRLQINNKQRCTFFKFNNIGYQSIWSKNIIHLI